MLRLVRAFVRNQRGATAIEYGLIAGLVVVAMMAALGNTANSTINMWNNISNKVLSANRS